MSPPIAAAAAAPAEIPPEIFEFVRALARCAARDDYRALKAKAQAEREAGRDRR